jgi:hypothetical protein
MQEKTLTKKKLKQQQTTTTTTTNLGLCFPAKCVRDQTKTHSQF